VLASHLDNPGYWRKRAQELRELASQVTLAEARRQLLEAAQEYERLAERAEERSKDDS
jgi:hypothetical protein